MEINFEIIIGNCIANDHWKGFEINNFNRILNRHPDYTREEFCNGLNLALNQYQVKFDSTYRLEREKKASEIIGWRNSILEDNRRLANLWDPISEPEKHFGAMEELNTQKELKLSKISEIETSLNSMSVDTFKVNEMIYFTMNNGSQAVGSCLISQGLIQTLKRLIDEFEGDKENQTPVKPREFVSFFNKVSGFNYVMNLLVEKGYCQGGTYKWIDGAKGSKSILVAIIKFLYAQGYLKIKPSQNDIKDIVQNFFGIDIALSTIKSARPENFNLKFIPIASTIA